MTKLVVLLIMALVANIATAVDGDFTTILEKTNLVPWYPLDLANDYDHENYFKFGKDAPGGQRNTLKTLEYWNEGEYPPAMMTAQLAEQVRRGRIQELGVKSHETLNLQDGDDSNWIILTDLEPDDRIALMMLSQLLSKKKVLAVGVNLLNAGRKAAEAKQLLQQIGWGDVTVVQGNGGAAKTYPDFASNRAALSFAHESIDQHEGWSSLRLQRFITTALQQATTSEKKINVLVLSPCTDLANAFLSFGSEMRRRVQKSLNHVVLTGGWVTPPGTNELRTTYNWNIDPISAKEVLDFVPHAKVFSSHIIKPTFQGGSINASNSPRLISVISESQHPAFKEFRQAGRRWDQHLIEKIPPLAGVVGPYVGKQFTPADVLAALYIVDPTIVTSTDSSEIRLDLHDVNDKGARARLTTGSKHSIVSGIDVDKFKSLMLGGAISLHQKACDAALR